MKRKTLFILLAAVIVLAAAGVFIGSKIVSRVGESTALALEPAETPAPVPTATPSPEPTPEPTPEIKSLAFPNGVTALSDDVKLDLSSLRGSQLEQALPLLTEMKELEYINLGAAGREDALSFEAVAAVQEACPQADVDFAFSLFGYDFTTLDEVMDLNHVKMDDQGAAVRKALSCMKKLKTLDMDFCNVDDEHMAAIREDYPNVDVIWRIWFGANCSVRTDTEKILAHNFEHDVTDYNSTGLKYCTKVKYLDIAHQHLTDISFISGMKDLEVFLISSNPITDLSPIVNCPKMEYLEILCTKVTDISPLSALQDLEHLNMVDMRGDSLEGWETLAGLTKLKRLWLAQDDRKLRITDETLQMLQQALPNTVIDNADARVNMFWRYTNGTAKTERFALLSEQFGYDDYNYQCSRIGNDHKYYQRS